MNTPFRMVSDLHRLGAGFSVRFTLDDSGFKVQWHPKKPTRREYGSLKEPYRNAVQAFMEEASKRLGLSDAPVLKP